MCAQRFQEFQPFPLQSHKVHCPTIFCLPRIPSLAPLPPSPTLICKCQKAISSIDLPPNALRRKLDPQWRGGFSLGVDLGTSRTGLALSKGFSTRPLGVLELRGQKLEVKLIEIAEQEEADEFIIGLPKSCDGKETPQSNKIRSIAGRVATRAAERGLNKSTRQKKIDAYAAMMVLERYFFMSGEGTELVVPKSLILQDKLIEGPPTDPDFKD
ncbi:putative pre-16S rRNA nuclease isoform X2 [Benincasa hispida]|uniref:putative pre-16S rRNA nuclease isoform X2 n=1 Tax=Benincasa hispida TaxID=102211 RepID=UPI00190043DA|nr:putative pre-16S rRNA nuclease isoform X2 [Benincasa hispida]